MADSTNARDILLTDHTPKVVLFGPAMRNKTRVIESLKTGSVRAKGYVPTLGVEVHPLVFNGGAKCLNVWDCAGQAKLSGMRSGYFMQAKAIVLWLDDADDADPWIASVRNVETCPIVIVRGDTRDLESCHARLHAVFMDLIGEHDG